MRFNRLLPPFIALAALVASITLWHALSAKEKGHIRHNISLKADVAATEVDGHLRSMVLALVRMSRRWETQGRPPQEVWESDAGLYVEHYRGYRALEWMDSKFRTRWLVTPEGTSPPRLNPEQVWLGVLNDALQTRSVRLSSSMDLADGARSFIVCIPLFPEGRFDGFLTATFGSEKLLEGIFKTWEDPGDYYVTVTNEDKALFRSSPADRVLEDDWTHRKEISLYGTTWRVGVGPTPGYLKKERSHLPETVRNLGVVLGLLLASSVYFGQKARAGKNASEKANAELEKEISEHKLAQEALEESEQRLRSILNNSMAVVYLKDTEGRYLFINRRFETLFNIKNESLEGKTDYDIFQGEMAESLRANDLDVLEAGTPLEFEETVPHEDGIHTYISTKFPLFDSGGEAYAVCGFSTDITDRKEMEKALEEHARELERSNTELEQFAYVASHDLQEPLRIVAGYVQLLARRYRGRLDADADEFIEYAVDGATRMQRLISDLLAYSRVGRSTREFVPVDLNNIMEGVLRNLGAAIKESGAEVTCEGLPTVAADASQIEHLFLNLVSNAIKYKSKAPPRVELRAEEGPEGWLFSVKDNGIGIDPKYAERIFVIFQRLHGKTEYKGTGIGLAICKKVVENHGGRIWMESSPDGGSEFKFTIPKARG